MKKGFNMAEVLITLGIIGVLAAITLPGVVQNIQDRRFKAMYKHDIAMISQAMKMLYASEDVEFTSGYEIPKYLCKLKKYIKVDKMPFDCNAIAAKTDAFISYDTWYSYRRYYNYSWPGKVVSKKNGEKITVNSVYNLTMMQLSNGAVIMFPCTNNLLIDVNGFKKPNVIGKDIFVLPAPNSDGKLRTSLSRSNFYANECIGGTSALINSNNYKEDCLHGTGFGCSFLYLLDE